MGVAGDCAQYLPSRQELKTQQEAGHGIGDARPQAGSKSSARLAQKPGPYYRVREAPPQEAAQAILEVMRAERDASRAAQGAAQRSRRLQKLADVSCPSASCPAAAMLSLMKQQPGNGTQQIYPGILRHKWRQRKQCGRRPAASGRQCSLTLKLRGFHLRICSSGRMSPSCTQGSYCLTPLEADESPLLLRGGRTRYMESASLAGRARRVGALSARAGRTRTTKRATPAGRARRARRAAQGTRGLQPSQAASTKSQGRARQAAKRAQQRALCFAKYPVRGALGGSRLQIPSLSPWTALPAQTCLPCWQPRPSCLSRKMTGRMPGLKVRQHEQKTLQANAQP